MESSVDGYPVVGNLAPMCDLVRTYGVESEYCRYFRWFTDLPFIQITDIITGWVTVVTIFNMIGAVIFGAWQLTVLAAKQQVEVFSK